ncbi:MAG: hypothetical protein HZC40_14140 [Chloroflexi bacterium]|nr:hypothetical protein [Chloroflexota bacterium]
MTTRRLFTAIFFLALFAMAVREISDPDFWWHLRAGQSIIETRSIPHADIFSHTNAGRAWVMHEWLAEVLIYAIYALGSFPALILAFAGIITLTFAFVYARMPGKPFVATFVLLFAATATAPTWGVRPQMLSLLFASIFLYILDLWSQAFTRSFSDSEAAIASSPNARAKLVWLLVPLMILWVNLHSGYALGLVIIAVYLFGNLISNFQFPTSNRKPPTIQLSNHPTIQLALVFLACLAVVPLNPNGATMYIYPFETLTSRAMQAYIVEWFSPDFHQIEFQPFAWLLLATLAALARSGKRVTLTQTILLAGFAYAGLRSARNIPIFAIIAAPILAEQVWHWIETRGWANGLARQNRVSRGMVIGNWFVLAIIVVAVIARVGIVIANQANIERAKFPAAAVDFLQKENLPGALYNSYGWGGYLIWRLYPAERVFIDGRADVYGDAFIEDVFLKAYRGGADWRTPLEQSAVRVVLIEPGAPLAVQLAREREWQKVYEDQQAVIYTR